MACLIVLIGIFFVVYYTSKNEAPVATKTLAVVSQSEVLRNKVIDTDTDGDLLKDWEETLWNTDSKKTDTDGDGTNDGEEVKVGRDPAVKGPKDKLEVKTQVAATTTTTVSRPVTPTDVLGRDLFAQYLDYKSNGRQITPEVEDKIVENIFVNAQLGRYSGSVNAKIYNTSEIKTSNNNSQDAIRAYGNAMGTILYRNSPTGSEAELAILERALNDNTPEEVAKLDPFIAAYKKMINDMRALTVPSDVAHIHLSVINNLSTVVTCVESMANIFQDPITAIAAMQKYLTAAEDAEVIFSSVTTFFTNKGIAYASSDPGYIFIKPLE